MKIPLICWPLYTLAPDETDTRLRVNKGNILLWDAWTLLSSHHFSGRTHSKALAEGHAIISQEEATDENKQVFTRVPPSCCIVNLEGLVVWRLVVPVRRWTFAHWKCWLITHPSGNGFHRNHVTKEIIQGTVLFTVHRNTQRWYEKLVTMIVNVQYYLWGIVPQSVIFYSF